MSVSYEILDVSGNPFTSGSGSSIASDLSVDPNTGSILWTDPTNTSKINQCSSFRFTYSGLDQSNISIAIRNGEDITLSSAIYYVESGFATPQQGGYSFTQSGGLISIAIVPPEPPASTIDQLSTDCSTYPRVTWTQDWALVGGLRPTKLQVKIKRQKGTASGEACDW
ncbi:hypothetical protein G6O69_34645 [Pseudenhygromyxa sp. WMMC2535]|uniref:hypothetical protein n=1 Tax=Pseudenhygromyxa sp. WMMC2535 TaxID=2712867 RepID=UPI0015531C25|nr:hypothetical protein [Pseudenhygromyxa sp. WMMC2535]NVB43013.1 hypothetical protein [Pseudenhygromyxa sp. WMMC2535]